MTQLSVRIVLAMLLLVPAACTAQTRRGSAPDSALVTQAETATRLKEPLRLVFDWSLQDREARFSGEGVTRIEPQYKARLDLFGPRGETYLSAALVDFELRLPPGATSDILPPPALFWSVLGVFRAPPGAELIAASGDSSAMELRYRSGQETWNFVLNRGRLQRAEWQGPEQGRQTVEIREHGERDMPARVVYRDWRAFRELTLTLNRIYDAQPYPAEIWSPGR